MNLLLLNYEYPPVGGGAANATQAIGRAFLRKGHTVAVLTSGLDGSPMEVVEEGIHVHRLLGCRANQDRGTFFEMISFIAKGRHSASQLHQRNRFDASIAFFTIPSGPISHRLWRSDKVPYIVSLRGGDVPGHVPGHKVLHVLTRYYRRAILKSARAVVANSEGLAETSRAADPFPVHAIPNGVDCGLYHPRTIATGRRTPSDPLKLLFVGRLHPEKNLAVVITQIAALPSPHRSAVKLTVIGDGVERAELEKLAERVGVAPQIQWLGWREKEELPSHYRNADALVNPSFYEGMPNVVLEAMATGIPVIASDVPGNRSVVVPNVTGILFPLENPDILGSTLCRLSDQPSWAVSLGAAGRQRAESTYSWDATAQSYLELLA
jgi:glycogen(starch) synthase